MKTTDKSVLRLVKTETKEECKYQFTDNQKAIDPSGYVTAAAKILDALKLVIGKDVNEFAMPVIVTIMKNHIPQPEPEESQKDLLYAIRTMESIGAPDEAILQRFIIQRKKQ